MDIHFIDVGCGNMVLIRTSSLKVIYDCNVTDDNEGGVFRYLRRTIGAGKNIDIFICSHRDTDHMRGIRRLHAAYNHLQEGDIPFGEVLKPFQVL